MHEVREVALLALIYRECYLNRRDSPDAIGDDLDTCPGEVSWLTMIALHRLTESDWTLLAALEEPSDFLPLARRLDPLRAEALMHAVPPKGRCSQRAWADPYRERWGHVRSRMRQFEGEGLTSTRDTLDSLAAAAWMAATGDSFEQYADRWT